MITKKNEIKINYFWLRSIFWNPGVVKEISNDEKELILKIQKEDREKEMSNLVDQQHLLKYFSLLENQLNRELERRSTSEAKAQSMIGFISFTVALFSIAIVNSSLFFHVNPFGLFGETVSLILLICPAIFFILSGIFARNVVITDYNYRYPSYCSDELKFKSESEILRLQIKDLIMCINSHDAFNNFKITSLKYSHSFFKAALYAFILLILWTTLILINTDIKNTKPIESINQEISKLKANHNDLYLENIKLKEKILIMENSIKFNERQIQIKDTQHEKTKHR